MTAIRPNKSLLSQFPCEFENVMRYAIFLNNESVVYFYPRFLLWSYRNSHFQMKKICNYLHTRLLETCIFNVFWVFSMFFDISEFYLCSQMFKILRKKKFLDFLKPNADDL